MLFQPEKEKSVFTLGLQVYRKNNIISIFAGENENNHIIEKNNALFRVKKIELMKA